MKVLFTQIQVNTLWQSLTGIIYLSLVSFEARAQIINIDLSKDPLPQLTDFLNRIIELAGGADAKFTLLASLVLFIFVWIWLPSRGLFGGLLKLVVGLAIVINTGAFLKSLGT